MTTTPLTPESIAELKRAAQVATPGPLGTYQTTRGDPATVLALIAAYEAQASRIAELEAAAKAGLRALSASEAYAKAAEDELGPCGCTGECEQLPETGVVYYGRLCARAAALRKVEPNADA